MGHQILAEAPLFHDASGSVRFWVVVDGKLKGASVSREALHHRWRSGMQGDDPMETFSDHVPEIEAAVRRRYAEGALEPVMLREYDLRDMGAQGPA